tara:strand:+ start:721 stop:894 length:174 start_codon:yes stop_codon:yes gene_type:complete
MKAKRKKMIYKVVVTEKYKFEVEAKTKEDAEDMIENDIEWPHYFDSYDIDIVEHKEW